MSTRRQSLSRTLRGGAGAGDGLRRAAWRAVALVLAAISALPTDAQAAQVHADVPAQIDPRARYLIFIQGPPAGEPVADAFVKRGFDVVTERRAPNPDPFDLAKKASAQVKRLRDGGVPGERIAVIGYDQGGAAALIAAAVLRDPAISFVALAGCGLDERFKRFAAQLADQMVGRALHLWEKTDPVAESCQLALSKAPALDSDEKLLSNGGGHEMFGEPDPFWMDLVQAFLDRR